MLSPTDRRYWKGVGQQLVNGYRTCFNPYGDPDSFGGTKEEIIAALAKGAQIGSDDSLTVRELHSSCVKDKPGEEAFFVVVCPASMAGEGIVTQPFAKMKAYIVFHRHTKRARPVKPPRRRMPRPRWRLPRAKASP